MVWKWRNAFRDINIKWLIPFLQALFFHCTFVSMIVADADYVLNEYTDAICLYLSGCFSCG